jgi:hypothetical protein
MREHEILDIRTARWLAPLLAVALTAGACAGDRTSDPARQRAQEPAAAPAETTSSESTAALREPVLEAGGQPAPTTAGGVEEPEARPELSSRDVAPPAPQPDTRAQARTQPQAPRAAEVAERERQLAAREAELAAREAEITARESAVADADSETPAPAAGPAAEEQVAEAPQPPPPPPRVEARLEAGTGFEVEFVGTVSSASSQVGDTFRTRVTRDVYDDRGHLVIPVGSEVVGVVTEAVPLRKVGGRASLGLDFTDLVLSSGETSALSAAFVREGKSESGRDAATIGGAAAGGAILGRILDRDKKGRGTVLGAIIGAAAGTVIASRTAGEEIVIPAGSVVGLELDRELRLEVPLRR